MPDAVEHMQKVQEAVRDAAERIGQAEAEHGPDSEEASQARARWNDLMDELATEAEELSYLIDDLKREYF